MFDISIDLHWYIISQAFGVFALGCFFVALQIKHKPKILAIIGIGSLLGGFMYFMLGMMMPAIFWFIGFFRGLAFAFIDAKRGKFTTKRTKWIPVFVLLIFSFALVTTASLTWSSFVCLGMLVFSLLNVYFAWAKGSVHLMRITIVFKALFVIIANIFAENINIAGIIIEINYLVAIIIFYIKFKKSHIRKRGIISIAQE